VLPHAASPITALAAMMASTVLRVMPSGPLGLSAALISPLRLMTAHSFHLADCRRSFAPSAQLPQPQQVIQRQPECHTDT
jgi:hypothetical protein